MWWSKSLCWNHLPIAFGLITICQNTFPLNLPLFCNGKVFWRIENAGNVAKRPLKTPSHCKKFTKMPQNSLKTMPKAWKRGPPSPSPMCDHFSEALVDFTMQNWGEIGQKLKRLISLFDQMQGKGVLTNWCWYVEKEFLRGRKLPSSTTIRAITRLKAEKRFMSWGSTSLLQNKLILTH